MPHSEIKILTPSLWQLVCISSMELKMIILKLAFITWIATLHVSKQEMEKYGGEMDESLLATANAWMRKAAEDKLDGSQ